MVLLSLNISCYSSPPGYMPCFSRTLPRTIPLYSDDIYSPKCNEPGFAVELTVALLRGAGSTFDDYYNQITFRTATGYGSRLPNGQWSGMIGDIVNNQSEVTLTSLVPSPDRMEVVDFVNQPPFFTDFCFAANPTRVPKVKFLECFDYWSWTSLVVLYVCMVLAIALKCHMGNLRSQIFDAGYDASFRQDYQRYQLDLSGAILTVTWSHFVSRMLFVALAATLYCQTQKPIEMPRDYSDIPHFLAAGYKLFLHKNTYPLNQLMTSDHVTFVRIREALTPHNFYQFEGKSNTEIITGGENRMLYDACDMVQSIVRQNPGIVMSRVRLGMSLPVSMAMKKQLPKSMKQSLSYQSSRMQEHGIVTKLAHKYLVVSSEAKKEQYSFTVETFSNTFMIYFSLSGVSIIAFGVELLAAKWKTRKYTY